MTSSKKKMSPGFSGLGVVKELEPVLGKIRPEEWCLRWETGSELAEPGSVGGKTGCEGGSGLRNRF